MKSWCLPAMSAMLPGVAIHDLCTGIVLLRCT